MSTLNLDNCTGDKKAASSKSVQSHSLSYKHVHGQGRKWRVPLDAKLAMQMDRYVLFYKMIFKV